MVKSGKEAEVLEVDSLVAYQQGSVVSRTILQKEAGTVTLFAFDKGQNLSEHTVPYDALVHILDGKAQITVAGVPHVAEQGEIIIMPGNEPHAIDALEKFKMMLTMIRV